MRKSGIFTVSSGLYIMIIVSQTVKHIEKQGKRVLGHRTGGISGYIFYQDPPGTGISKINIVHACGSQRHQLQMRGTGKSGLIHGKLVDNDHIRILDPFRNLFRLCHFIKGHMAQF